MSVRVFTGLACDTPNCGQRIEKAKTEDIDTTRRRARRDNGWRSTPSCRSGGHTDLCRYHA